MQKITYARWGSFVLAAAFFISIITTGCARRDSGRVYDPEYHDYHQWNSKENSHYQQWEAETHRSHKDFQQRSRDTQNQYWTWRHQHPGGGDHH